MTAPSLIPSYDTPFERSIPGVRAAAAEQRPAPRIQPIQRVQRADGEFRVFRVDRRRELELRGRDRAEVDRLVGYTTLPPSLDVWSLGRSASDPIAR